jgi:hypothetical protein
MMSTDAYLDAKAVYDRVSAELDAVANLLRTVAAGIQGSRGSFIFSNVNVGLPPEASMSRGGVSVNGNDWPTAEAIQQKLAQWHVARTAMHTTWSAVPADRKAGLIGPPGPAR